MNQYLAITSRGLENLLAERKYFLETIGVNEDLGEAVALGLQKVDEFICGGTVEIPHQA